MRIAVCIVILIAGASGLVAGADDTQAPGVLVRLYDIGAEVPALPELAQGELPNVVKVVPTLDLRGERGDFAPLESWFVTEVIAVLTVERAGQYCFRLVSDDGSRLSLDGKLLIDHDGLHGPTAKDSEPVALTVGPHELRIWHLQGGGGAQLTLLWSGPPGHTPVAATSAGQGAEPVKPTSGPTFDPIPPAQLSHPRNASRETSPGTKKIIPPLRRGRPGDGTPVATPHPGFTFGTRPAETEGEPLRVAGGFVERVPGGERAGITLWVPDFGPDSIAPLLSLPTSAYGAQYQVRSEGGEWKRIAWDEVNGHRQGCVFRFSAGEKPAIGAGDVWPFELRHVRALANGLELEFTRPLDPRVGWDPECYYLEQWPLDVTAGTLPRRDGTVYPVRSASVSADRTRVFLELDELKPAHVVYIRLLPPCLSEDGQLPWSTEAWYTLSVVPPHRRGTVRTPPPAPPQNVLTDEEKAAGWRLLFDGHTPRGWHAFGKTLFPRGWQVQNGCLVRVAAAGDIATDEEFGDFELCFEWRVSAGGNSGVFYRVSEDRGAPWETGPEYQILDNAEHPDGRNPLTSAASCYALYAPERDVTQPVGFFNQARIVARGNHVEHWLNGVKVVEYELHSPDWQERVAQSKFSKMPDFGLRRAGRICLQDHGDKVWYRNIKVRPLNAP